MIEGLIGFALGGLLFGGSKSYNYYTANNYYNEQPVFICYDEATKYAYFLCGPCHGTGEIEQRRDGYSSYTQKEICPTCVGKKVIRIQITDDLWNQAKTIAQK
jgi:hypothetical protein